MASLWLLGEEDKVSSPSVAIVSATPTRPDYRIGFASRRNLPNSPPLSQPSLIVARAAITVPNAKSLGSPCPSSSLRVLAPASDWRSRSASPRRTGKSWSSPDRPSVSPAP
ncbi:hypothetical protein BREVUG8_20006 [Brevundimonas sp. G8]|nr:hypothetical protein BREVUG8_20006 [Brevundimonas sp. G8]